MLLANPVATYLGRRSYAIYLWSWPVQVLVAFRRPDLGSVALAVATVLASLLLAEASHRLVEEPLRRGTGWAGATQLRRPAWALVALVPVALVGATLVRSEPSPPGDLASPAASAAEALRAPLVPTEVDGADRSGRGDDAALGGTPAAPVVAEPQRVLLLGDSVAWTIGRHAPEGDDLPRGVASIDGRGLIGCGLLAGEGWKYRSRVVDGPFTAPPGDSCSVMREAEDLGLAGAPGAVLIFVGAWEWIDARSPDGEVVEARSPRMAELLVDRLVDRIERAHAVGARVLLVEWVCPGSRVRDGRADERYVTWINGVLADAVAAACCRWRGRRRGPRAERGGLRGRRRPGRRDPGPGRGDRRRGPHRRCRRRPLDLGHLARPCAHLMGSADPTARALSKRAGRTWFVGRDVRAGSPRVQRGVDRAWFALAMDRRRFLQYGTAAGVTAVVAGGRSVRGPGRRCRQRCRWRLVGPTCPWRSSPPG